MFTLVAFGLSALLHIYQILRSRYWSFVMVVMGCGGEMYGWSMRWIGGQNLLRGCVPFVLLCWDRMTSRARSADEIDTITGTASSLRR